MSNKKSWRCFHCDEVFIDIESARVHFGGNGISYPLCQFSQVKIRDMENELRKYREEDTDLHRQIANLHSSHAQALMRSEELGYAKGLADGRKQLTPLE